jgi:hypothetical protein
MSKSKHTVKQQGKYKTQEKVEKKALGPKKQKNIENNEKRENNSDNCALALYCIVI